jgi:hypothetical protein
MSRRPQKAVGIAQPGNGPGANTNLLRVALIRVTPDGKLDAASKALGKLLLNPESWEDDKTTNWVANSVPGQSDPLYQWVSGGPRIVSFDALVTNDTAEFLQPKDDPLAGLIDNAVNAVGSIASNFLGVNLPPVADIFAAINGVGGSAGEELSIENQLNYYRSLLYPKYAQGRLESSPPLIVIYAGKTLGSLNTVPSDTVSPDHDLWVLTELRIRVTKQLPNLTPMEAVCSFRFNQYPTASLGSNHFLATDNTATAPAGGSIGQIVSGFFS